MVQIRKNFSYERSAKAGTTRTKVYELYPGLDKSKEPQKMAGDAKVGKKRKAVEPERLSVKQTHWRQYMRNFFRTENYELTAKTIALHIAAHQTHSDYAWNVTVVRKVDVCDGE